MNILFLTHHKHPHIGGVERHLQFLIFNLQFLNKDIKIKTISEEDIKQPHIKIFGLLYIWYWLLKNRSLITRSDLVHIHDVFIWYLPFRFLFPNKKVFITFHGWEGKWPLPMWIIINKRVANYLCNGSIAVGKYIEKYYKIKCNFVIYGATTLIHINRVKKIKNSIVYLGRQDQDTGINEFKKWLITQKNKYKVVYITNDPKPEKYLKTAEYCVPAGYLSYLEAKSYGCKIMTFTNNPLKEDYWKEIKTLKTIPTWDEVAEVYIKLWNI